MQVIGPDVQELEKFSQPVYVHLKWCKGCGVCVKFCPKQVLEIGEDNKCHVVNPENCIACKMCENLCPDMAIIVNKDAVKKGGEK